LKFAGPLFAIIVVAVLIAALIQRLFTGMPIPHRPADDLPPDFTSASWATRWGEMGHTAYLRDDWDRHVCEFVDRVESAVELTAPE